MLDSFWFKQRESSDLDVVVGRVREGESRVALYLFYYQAIDADCECPRRLGIKVALACIYTGRSKGSTVGACDKQLWHFE